jgi:hypothetical protein
MQLQLVEALKIADSELLQLSGFSDWRSFLEYSR